MSALVRHVRGLGRTVGVISVDPSSPFTQGALLGDRIRLSDHFLDPEVFIRSMGTRGHLGGLAETTLQAALLLDAAGKDLILLETVGTGQSEIEVIGIADTVLLVLMPGSGDSVQALKAGIMEIPDVIAINKMDHPAAKTMLNEVRSILALDRESPWKPPIVLTEAVRGEGVPEAVGAARGTSDLPRGGRAARGAAAQEPGRRGVRARVQPREDASAGGGGRRRRAPPAAGRGAGARARSALGRPRDPREGLRHWQRQQSRPCVSSRRRSAASRASPASRRSTPPRRSRVAPARSVQLKAENLQRTGAFKIRGAVNTIGDLGDEERAAGVVAASAGNHGQAVAWAAREAGIEATIFMPEDSPMAKVEATRNYGAQVELVGAGFDESLAAAQERVAATGATFLHAFEDERVIAGQGTVGLEIVEAAAVGRHRRHPGRRRRARLGHRDRAARAAAARPARRRAGRGGLPVRGRHRAPLHDRGGDRGQAAGHVDASILERPPGRDRHRHGRADQPMRSCSSSSARSCSSRARGQRRSPRSWPARSPATTRSVSILSGGNIDPTLLIQVMRHGLTQAGRYLVLRTRIADRPGELIKLLAARGRGAGEHRLGRAPPRRAWRSRSPRPRWS